MNMYRFPAPADGDMALDTLLADMASQCLTSAGFQTFATIDEQGAALKTAAPEPSVKQAIHEAHVSFCSFMRDNFGHADHQMPPAPDLLAA